MEKVSPAEVGFVFQVMFDPFYHGSNHCEIVIQWDHVCGIFHAPFSKGPVVAVVEIVWSPHEKGIRRYGMDYLVVANLSKMVCQWFTWRFIPVNQ